MQNHNNILLAFYGDDFTGSTDALEFMTRAGAKTVLFIEPPTTELLQRYPGLQAFGVAGMTRAMSPEQMEQTLLPAFEKLKQTGARHVHYKVCSTFDSAPHIGSIGKAIDTGAAVFKHAFVPLLVAAPVLGRYCLFGNLFARMGIGSQGAIYRLDRHPSMSKHPVTPSDESDLRLHLAKQTKKKIGLINILQLPDAKTALQVLAGQGAGIILFDALYQEQLTGIGAFIDQQAQAGPLFSAGSSGVEMALGQYWNQTGLLQPVQEWKHPGPVDRLLVICGSCSPVTAAQIEHAKANGFEEVVIDAHTPVPTNIPTSKSIIIHTGGTTKQHDSNIPAEILGTALGSIAKEMTAQYNLPRIVIAGGDTSSYAARAMGIEAVEMTAALVPGAPLCKATAPGSPLHNKEVNFKGGQVGGADYFSILKSGEI
jgi:uncharacterized protein YgbK (DUF1537 family)